ncbi:MULTISPECIES: carbohydrate ABC transporter permease [unclassified Rathayibacter]|uniref:carbohydrate ABC transporter permease n=1 Tax=unclassified Rathayibacter TaxID=2609250 RepID=UPI000F4B4405|nr:MULTISPECIES: sugar ABC transporter permease [unclassified Rathayibacter]ROP49179.1 raffinose/stachyose/melibiose transport system permease protein/glucose/mannose transport system permease protein [Rathayibacter sp. PhB186]ROS50704.1 raffinose/stachyose/melibiose transport system permease protein/glucose/mannose transport system permease protein [Rathayibacter sp. PhB185]
MTRPLERPTRRRRPPSQWRSALLFLLPLLAVYAVYYAYSIVFLAQTSTQRVGISLLRPVQVGFDNFILLLQDAVFWQSIGNNLVFAGVSIGVSLTIAFFIAVALSTGVRGRKVFYLVFLLPALMPLSLVATIFGSMLQSRNGAVNETLRAIGLGDLAQSWLTTPQWAYIAVILVFCYLIGLPIMYYTADLSALPTSALEAALLDGAGTFRIMRSIIYPMMRSTHITVILALLLGSFRALEQVLFSTDGGPGSTTEIVGTYLYSSVNSGGKTIGFAASASIVVLLIALVISVLQMFATRTRKADR